MVAENPAYLATIRSTSGEFWDQVDGAAKYNAALARKAEQNPGKYSGHTWMDDTNEKAHRIWELWRAKAKRDNLQYFGMTARIVVLVQMSSASVERVFSQVKLIVNSIGENALEDNLETRLVERVNKYGI